MKTKFYGSAIIILLLAICNSMHAQTNTFPSTGAAGIGTITPDASSLLEIKSTSKGLLISRMTKTQRDAIPTPATGLMIYQTNSTPGFYYYSGTAWTAVAPKSKGWSLTGNAGTITGTNFIGTTDAQPLMFKVNNAKAGLLDYNGATANAAFGYQSLNSNTGNSNSAFGYQSLFSNTTGSYNTANGYQALYANNTSDGNTANGSYALYYNTTANYNTANGYAALYNNTTGTENTSTGHVALFANTTGYNNTANGSYALSSNTTGIENTANGVSALYKNTIGYFNIADGVDALRNNTEGSYNTANGDGALYSNTTGYWNTANGYQSLYYNTTAKSNTANGLQALYNNTMGNYNTANGWGSLFSNTTGFFNTADGLSALAANTTGNYNTALGEFADVSTGNLTNATIIGAGASVDASNKVWIGNTSVTSIGGQVGWSTFSDGRYKKNIKEDVKGLAFINSLKPITYTVDINGLNSYFDKNRKHDEAYDKMKKDMQPAADEASKIVYNGFIAQDVEAAAKKLNYDFSGVDKPQAKDGLYGLRYADFVVPLVKAVQELDENQNSKFKIQNDEIAELKERISKLELIINNQQTIINNQSAKTISSTSASLEQNIPNPFNHTTTINYTLPQQYLSAKIIVVDKAGKVLKEINVSGAGKGSLNIDASTLASGTYNYSLLVDGKLIATKQMEHLK